MGILADDEDEDVRAITWVADWSARAYNYYCEQHPQVEQLHVEVNANVIAVLSDIGGKVLARHFQNPDLLGRIAALIVVSNCCPPFTLTRRGRPVTSLSERRRFFATLSPAFVAATFAFYRPKDNVGAYRFSFPDEGRKERFLAYLELMDIGEIAELNPGGRKKEEKAREESSLRILAKDVLGVTEFLSGCVTFDETGKYGVEFLGQ